MKINLLFILLFSSSLLNAQIQKGAIFIGGDFSVNGNKATTTNPNNYPAKNTALWISPSIGWVVKENIVVGGNLLLSYFQNEQQPTVTFNKGNRIGGGIWMRKYLPLGKSFYLFGNAGLSVQSIYNKYTIVQQPYYSREKGYTVNAALTPGLSYQIKKSLFLELALNNLISLGFERKNMEEQNQNGTVYKGTNESYNLATSLGGGIPLQIGMRWIIGKY